MKRLTTALMLILASMPCLQALAPATSVLPLKEQMDDMQIPKYYGAIPHYLIYDREGRLVKAISGWSDVESMKEELDKVQ